MPDLQKVQHVFSRWYNYLGSLNAVTPHNQKGLSMLFTRLSLKPGNGTRQHVYQIPPEKVAEICRQTSTATIQLTGTTMGYLGIRKLDGEFVRLHGEMQVADFFELLAVRPGDNQIPPFDNPDENPMTAPAASKGFLQILLGLRNRN